MIMPAVNLDINVMATKMFIVYPKKQQPRYKLLIYFDLKSGKPLAVSIGNNCI